MTVDVHRHFATAAMQGLCANPTWWDHVIPANGGDMDKVHRMLVTAATDIADKLIAKLNENKADEKDPGQN
jgi:hypothetical protein